MGIEKERKVKVCYLQKVKTGQEGAEDGSKSFKAAAGEGETGNSRYSGRER